MCTIMSNMWSECVIGGAVCVHACLCVELMMQARAHFLSWAAQLSLLPLPFRTYDSPHCVQGCTRRTEAG